MGTKHLIFLLSVMFAVRFLSAHLEGLAGEFGYPQTLDQRTVLFY